MTEDRDGIINRYNYLHEKQGSGFLRGCNKGYAMTQAYLRKDGSLYIDAIPVLTEKQYTLMNLASGLPVTISNYFHINNPKGTLIYGGRPQLFYKH